MKTFCLVSLLALCLAIPAVGQNYAYHDNSSPTSTSTNTFPFGNAFGNNWRYQFTVPAASLPSQPCRFTEVGFSSTVSGTFTVKDFQLRMAHTTSLALSTVFANNFASTPVALINVQNGKYSFTATHSTWTDLGCTGSFDWDGQRHLVIEIRYRGTGTLAPGTASLRAHVSTTNSNRLWANGSYPAPGPADPYVATTGRLGTSGAIKVRLTYVTITITASGTPTPGGTVDLALLSPADATRAYQVATSLGPGPTAIGKRSLGLTVDKLMEVTVNGYLPAIFRYYSNVLDGSGKAKAQIKVPNDSRLKGVRLYSAFVTLDGTSPFGISNISNTVIFSIQ